MEKYNRGQYVHKIATDYCVLDTETTGLSPYYDSIIEIGILRIRNNSVVAEYQQLINPQCELDPYISNLTGITPDMLDNQPTIDMLKNEILSFIGNDLIVGHNTHFDMQFLANELSHNFSNEYIDTCQLAKKVYPQFPTHSLTILSQQLNLPIGGHRALNDCKTTKALLDSILDEMNQKSLSVEHLFSAKRIDVSQITPTESIPNDHFFSGKHCVFTGTLSKMSRNVAMQKVVNLGGILDNNVVLATNFLIVGGFEYQKSIKNSKTGKLKKAEERKAAGQDIEIIDEHTFYDLLDL